MSVHPVGFYSSEIVDSFHHKLSQILKVSFSFVNRTLEFNINMGVIFS